MLSIEPSLISNKHTTSRQFRNTFLSFCSNILGGFCRLKASILRSFLLHNEDLQTFVSFASLENEMEIIEPSLIIIKNIKLCQFCITC